MIMKTIMPDHIMSNSSISATTYVKERNPDG